MKKKRIYIGVLVLSLALLVLFEWLKPKPVDWTESYSGLDKIPFGCYIIRDLLPDLFPNAKLYYQNEPIFTSDIDSSVSHNIIYINRTFAPDTYETDKLIHQAKSGHRIFIAASNISSKLADTLGITINMVPILPADSTQDDSVTINFQNPDLNENTPWTYTKFFDAHYFTNFDSLNSTVLGKTGNAANYIRVQYGAGAIYLHTMPKVFTNYYMLNKHKANYAYKALSYLPVQPTVWDEYYKLGRSTVRSPMHFIVSQDYLRWAWGTGLAGLLLFMIFRAKRRQRIIPKVETPKNSTLQFTRTISRLYFEHGSRIDIAHKKITFFLHYIRSRLQIDTQTIDKEFLVKVSDKTGIDYNTISKLFQQISSIQEKTSLSSGELQSINNKIELFYRETS